MVPFRWPEARHELALAKEVAQRTVTGRFANGSFRLPPVRLHLDSIRLRTVCQFAYVLNQDPTRQ